MNEFVRLFDNCPSCESPSSKAHHLFKVTLLGEECSVVECTKCGLIYKDLAPTASGLSKIYSPEYNHFHNNDSISLAEINSCKHKLSHCQKLLKTHRKANVVRLLDIGCGQGNFVEISRSLGYLAEGIDPYLPDHLRSSYLQKKSPELVPQNSYDIATLLNVVEHLDQPRVMFAAVRQLLKPNGVMLLTCPYGDSLARRIYRDSWNHLVLDEHLLFWTPRSLTSLLRELGFNGKVSYRIAGSPFPQGRAHLPTVPQLPTQDNQLHHPSKRHLRLPSFGSLVWKLGRAIQRQEATADLVRQFIHLNHLGDYLEYAIRL